MKQAFAFMSILRHFNFDFETWLKTDAFNFVVVVILSQKEIDGLLYFVAYMSKIMSSAECNYEIYDKEFLVIVWIFEKWHSKCVEIFVEEFIRVINDHCNLEHFMTTKQFNRRQVRWVKFLFEFNFKIKYCSDVQKAKLDSLIRRNQNVFSNSDDFRNQFQRQTIFKAYYFSKEFCICKKFELQFDIVKVVVLVLLFQAHNINKVAELVSLIYVLIEEELLSQEVVLNDIEDFFQESNALLSSEKLMIRIRETYSEDEKFQQIINVKQVDDRKISVDFRKKYQLKLKDCKVVDDLLRVNDKIVIFENDVLRINIIKIHHDEFVIRYSDRIDIFVNIS